MNCCSSFHYLVITRNYRPENSYPMCATTQSKCGECLTEASNKASTHTSGELLTLKHLHHFITHIFNHVQYEIVQNLILLQIIGLTCSISDLLNLSPEIKD